MLYNFTEEEKNQFNYQRFYHPHPRVQMKMEALWLYAHGKSNQEVAFLSGVCENTARTYLKEYLNGGIEASLKINFYQPKSELDKFKNSLEEYFQENPPMSMKEAAAKIEDLTGIKRSQTQVRKFFQRLGFKRLKIGYIPGKADVEEQKKYYENKLKPRLEEAQRNQRAVFLWMEHILS